MPGRAHQLIAPGQLAHQYFLSSLGGHDAQELVPQL